MELKGSFKLNGRDTQVEHADGKSGIMFLGYKEIIDRIEKENLLENVDPGNIQGAGVDLRIDRLYEIKSSSFIGKEDRKLPQIEEFNGFVIKPKQFLLFRTVEAVNMPDDLIAFMLPRSSMFRCGVSLRTAVIDPGYKGRLTVGIYNEGEHEFKLERYARVLQIVFARVYGESKGYDGGYQGGKISVPPRYSGF